MTGSLRARLVAGGRWLRRALTLLLPALMPSWNFFDWIAPSPRIEYMVLPDARARPTRWQPFSPLPRHVGPARMLRRLIWNPRVNERLYAISCAERLVETPTEHSEIEILRRIARDIEPVVPGSHLTLRLVFVQRTGQSLTREVRYVGTPRAIAVISPGRTVAET